MQIKIYGASDDLVEVEGDLREEFSCYDSGEPKMKYLGFSDGTLLSIIYGEDGMWRINRLRTGTASYSKEEATDSEGDNYSDHVTLEGDNFTWVVFGEHMVTS